jgi:hypothetical protein
MGAYSQRFSVAPLWPGLLPSPRCTPWRTCFRYRHWLPHCKQRTTIKLTSPDGTTHPCNDGHPGSLVKLRRQARPKTPNLQIGDLKHPVEHGLPLKTTRSKECHSEIFDADESQFPVRQPLFAHYGPGCVRTVKLISTGGTTHPCNDGHPGSLVELRHSDAVALLISDGSTAPFSGSA